MNKIISGKWVYVTRPDEPEMLVVVVTYVTPGGAVRTGYAYSMLSRDVAAAMEGRP
jgi:hypothetical protein